jgi:small subunit ribosomal protein S27Ae
MKKYQFFKVEGDKINRVRRHCPKCGPAVFIADHKDRFSCGKCGYTEFKNIAKKELKPEKPQELPIKQKQEKHKEEKIVVKPETAVQEVKKE